MWGRGTHSLLPDLVLKWCPGLSKHFHKISQSSFEVQMAIPGTTRTASWLIGDFPREGNGSSVVLLSVLDKDQWFPHAPLALMAEMLQTLLSPTTTSWAVRISGCISCTPKKEASEVIQPGWHWRSGNCSQVPTVSTSGRHQILLDVHKAPQMQLGTAVPWTLLSLLSLNMEGSSNIEVIPFLNSNWMLGWRWKLWKKCLQEPFRALQLNQHRLNYQSQEQSAEVTCPLIIPHVVLMPVRVKSLPSGHLLGGV
jgi:hypothetical protein